MSSEDQDVRYSHSGRRFVLGYGHGFFGIWDRQAPGPPIERFPRTDEGWRAAWLRYSGLEPEHVEVGTERPASAPAGVQPNPWDVSAPAPPPPPRQVNGAWWVAPILFGLVGGILAWAANRRISERTATAMLLVGIASGALWAIVWAISRPA